MVSLLSASLRGSEPARVLARALTMMHGPWQLIEIGVEVVVFIAEYVDPFLY
jgi:hypothetical protein